MTDKNARRFVVACRDYTTQPTTRAQAERTLARLNFQSFPGACGEQHEIREVTPNRLDGCTCNAVAGSHRPTCQWGQR